MIVDSTVQHQAMAHPTDSRLLETACVKLVEATKDAGIDLKQAFAKEGQHLNRKAGRYAHARQFKCMKRAISSASAPIVGRLLRMIARNGITLLHRLYWRLCQAAGIRPNWRQAVLTGLISPSTAIPA